MYTDFHNDNPYIFPGTFYEVGVDFSKPLDQQKDKKNIIFETLCDISDGNNLGIDKFSVCFEFDPLKDEIRIKDGDLFRGEIYGVVYEGRVVGVYPSMVGGCSVVLSKK